MRPNYQRSKNAIVGLYVMLGALAIVLIGEVFTLLFLVGSIEIPYEEIDFYDGLIRGTGIVYLGAFIGCAIVFIQWFRRAYYNLHKLVPSSKLRYTEGWAAGAWWIPIFWWIGPYQIATDLFTQSENLLVKNNLMEKKPKLHVIAGTWWALWVTQNILGNISSRMDSTIEIATVGTVLDIVGSVIAIGAALFAIQMINNYAPMEELLKRVPESGEGSAMTITNDDLLDSGI